MRFTPEGEFKTDLFSLNVQRGRDHQLPSYNGARAALNLPPKTDFTDFPKLEAFYNHPNDIDLWVGILGEPRVGNSILGEVGTRIVRRNFLKIRDGDKYWYERRPNGPDDKVYPREVVDHIKSISFADVIRESGVNGWS